MIDRHQRSSMRRFDALRHGLEEFSSTRVNSWLGLASDVGVGVALLWVAFRWLDIPLVSALCIVAIGLFAFSFVEYCFHRWLFHGSNEIFERGHYRHHEQPQGDDSLPFLFPPLGILALAELLRFVAPTEVAVLFTGGFAIGYAVYGLSHTMIHRMRFRNAFMRRWAAAHHVHHRHPDSNFGVTTPLWDFVMRTRYARRGPEVSSGS